MKNKIDFVILWVDDKDTEWRAERNKYLSDVETELDIEKRYRDWDNLQYWFRGVEKFASWVNRIYFVTYGHVPKWLNLKHPKLKVVTHKEFIPEEYLPTFSSRAIDLNLHRIPELSDQFVYFNDDMFIIDYVEQKDFFINGLPCDCAVLAPIKLDSNNYFAPAYNISIINSHFGKNATIKKNIWKWFNYRYGIKNLNNFLLMPWPYFTGLYNPHLPYSYLKSTYKEVWEEESKILTQACFHKFRNATDINHWLMSDWQIVAGNFSPRNPYRIGAYYPYGMSEEIDCVIYADIVGQKKKIICINDNCMSDFIEHKERLNLCFNEILGEKSTFEID